MRGLPKSVTRKREYGLEEVTGWGAPRPVGLALILGLVAALIVAFSGEERSAAPHTSVGPTGPSATARLAEGPTESFAKVFETLKSPGDAQARNLAVKELYGRARTDPVSTVAAIAAQLRTTSPALDREPLIRALGETGSEVAVPALTELYQTTIRHPKSALHLYEANLCLIGLARIQKPAAYARLLDEYALVPDDLRGQLIKAIAAYPEHSSWYTRWLKELRSSRADVREAAALALAESRLPEVEQALCRQLAEESDPTAAHAILVALKRHRSPDTASCLERYLDSEPNLRLRLDAVEALIAIGTEEAGHLLYYHSEKEEAPRVRRRAVQGAIQLLERPTSEQ